GIYKSGSSSAPEMVNNIVAFNMSSSGGAGIHCVDSATVTRMDYNNVYSNTIFPGVVSDYSLCLAGSNSISVDPAFVDMMTLDFRLQSTSMSRDAGDPDPAFNDADGTRNDPGAFGAAGFCLLLGAPPAILAIPDQIIGPGETFASISLDDFVVDPDDPISNLTWMVTGQTALTVQLDSNRIATVSKPSGAWSGSELLTFTVTDSRGYPDFDEVSFTANPAILTFTRLDELELMNSNVVLRWQGTLQHEYQAEVSTNLTDWLNIGTVVTGAGPHELTLPDAVPDDPDAMNYYRLRIGLSP
ncbi:MAG: hypothetical protein AAF492_23520, partial [Verrucomicrobiota bacterium]